MSSLSRVLLLLILTAVIAGGVITQRTLHEIDQPTDITQVDYAQSTTCVNCHPVRYETWRRTYHRTMTQLAGPEAVVGDFGDASYTYQGITSRFFRRGDDFFIETLNTQGEMETFPVVMTVGSRRFQQYVTQIGSERYRLPWAWHIEEERWIHLNGAFLYPDGTDFNNHTSIWDGNCIFCHNVKAQPNFNQQTGTFNGEVAEFGIGCEACHGPAAAHIARNTNPIRRYALYLSDRDPTIYSPHELPPEQQIQLCGHCHGQRLPDPRSRIEEFMTIGDPFTAGDDLDRYTEPIQRDTELAGLDLALRFWQDGTPRLTAYEYQGILLSEEHADTELTCTSCHNMHGGDPKGMIDPEMRGPLGCTQCHEEIEADIAGHTKHAAESSGSDCYACHMPENTYGLITVHRTHHIQNPEPARAWRYEMPEACTLCHTNETAVWAAMAMAEQYDLPVPDDLPGDEAFTEAESVRTLLSGDPVQRAVALHALSDKETYTTTAEARLWAVPFLLIGMEDQYPAARYVAYRGLRDLLAQTGETAYLMSTAQIPEFDYLAPVEERTAVARRWWGWWTAVDKSAIPHPGTAVPLDEDLNPIPARIEPLLAARSQEIITIGE